MNVPARYNRGANRTTDYCPPGLDHMQDCPLQQSHQFKKGESVIKSLSSINGLYRKVINGCLQAKLHIVIIKRPDLTRPEYDMHTRVCGQMMDSFDCAAHHNAYYDHADN